jgi:hypothetical protein
VFGSWNLIGVWVLGFGVLGVFLLDKGEAFAKFTAQKGKIGSRVDLGQLRQFSRKRRVAP